MDILGSEDRVRNIHFIKINKINHCDLTDLSIYETLTSDLRSFNEKICVVEINIKVVNESDNVDLRTRKIQSKIVLIQLKYGASTRNTNTSGMITPENAKIYQICICLSPYSTSPSKSTSPRPGNPITPSTSTKPLSLESPRRCVNSANLEENWSIVLIAKAPSMSTAQSSTARVVRIKTREWKRKKALKYRWNKSTKLESMTSWMT